MIWGPPPTSTNFNISTQGISVDTWLCPSDFILLLNDVANRRTLLTEEQEKEILELCKVIINECGPIWERQRACDACDLPFPESCVMKFLSFAMIVSFVAKTCMQDCVVLF